MQEKRFPSGLGSKVATVVGAFAVLALVSGCGHQDAQAGTVQGACTDTATAALKACKSEADADRWLAVGKCENDADAAEVDACIAEAETEREDAIDECEAQRDARMNLCVAVGEDPFRPEIDPANFVDPAEIGASVAPNPYFPLVPGTRWTYESDAETNVVEVTGETREILGVTVAVVHDVVAEDGETIEDTIDWYAQDTLGNVWYFGEIAQEFEDGRLASLEGSWEAGVEDAQPGIVMQIAPEVDQVYRQEFLLGEAEDVGKVIDVSGSEVASAASCNNDCVVTEDTTPIEPQLIEHKYYAPNIGLIVEITPDGEERLELVDFQQ